MGLLPGALACWLLAVAWSDWQRLRIPNALVLPVAAGLLAAAALGTHPLGVGAASAVGAVALVLGAGFACYALGWVGAGDVKFLAALGALFGAGTTLAVVWALGSLLAGIHVMVWWALRAWLPALPLAPGAGAASGPRRLPHGVHLAAAALLAVAGVLPAP